VIAIIATVITGLLMERIAYRPLRGAPDVTLLLTSFAGDDGCWRTSL